jgi:hypothetical protein
MALFYTPTSTTVSSVVSPLSSIITPVSPLSPLPGELVVTDTLVVTPPGNTMVFSPNPASPVSDAPYIASLNLSYSRPTFTAYENLNADSRIHNQLVKYFKYKVLDKWIYHDKDMKKLLGYLRVSNGKAFLVKNKNDFKYNENESMDDINAKIRFIENNVLTNSLVFKILKRFVHETNTNWYELAKSGNEEYVKDALEMGIRKHLKIQIEENK